MKKMLLTIVICASLITAVILVQTCALLGDDEALGISSFNPQGVVEDNLGQISVYFTHPMRKSLLGSQGPPKIQEGELGISHFSPSGEIGTQLNNITIHFTHAMIPLGEIKKVEASDLGIRIEPSIRGTYRWYGTQTWTFTAIEQLTPSTLYRVTIPAGICSVDGKKMRQSFAFEFETSPVIAPDPGIKIEPVLPGRFLWQGEQGITFEIGQRLQQATRYRVTIPAGIRSFDGKSLPKSQIFEFTTSPPYASYCTPYNGSIDVVLEPDICLYFTQPVNAEDVCQYIELFSSPVSSPDSLRRINIMTSREKNTQRISIKATKPLPKESIIWVKVRSGWRGLNGKLPCDSDFTSRFNTYCPFRYCIFQCMYKEHSSSAPGDNDIALYFNNMIVAQDFLKHISISPAPKDMQACYVQDKAIRLPSQLFQYGQNHTITVSPGLTDVFGQKLGQTVEQKLYMFDLNPSVDIEPNGGRVLASSPRFIRLSTINVPRLYLECYRADQSRIFSKQVNIYSDEDMYNLSCKQYEKVIKAGTPKNKICDELWSFDSMAKGMFSSKTKPGLFFLGVRTDSLRFHYEEYKTIERMAKFVISDLGITVRYGADNILIFVSSMQDGTPVADAKVIIRNKSNGILWEGATDRQGMALAPGKRKLPAMSIEPRIFVCKGDDMNYLELSGGSRDGWISGYDRYHQNLPDYTHFIPYLYTDRGVYRPGHTVHLTGIFRQQDELGVRRLEAAGQAVNINVQDARGRNIFSKIETVSDFDTFSTDIPIPENGPLGIYTANIQVSGKGSASKEFDVQEYRVSDFEVAIHADQPYFIQEHPVTVTISGKYLAGAPLTEAEVKWNIQVISYQPSLPSKSGYMVGAPSSNISACASGQSTASLDANGELKIKLYPVVQRRLTSPRRERYGHALRPRIPVKEDESRPREQLIESDLPGRLGDRDDIEPQPDLVENPQEEKILPEQVQNQNPPGIFFNGGPGVYQIIAEVTASNRQVVNATGEFTVYPGNTYVGLRLGQNVIKEGSRMNMSLLAFSPDGQSIPGLPMTVKVEHVLKQEGEYKLWAEKYLSLTSSNAPVECKMLFPLAGEYQITAQVKEKQMQASVSCTARAVDEASLADSGLQLEIIPDKEEYMPGQTASFLIRSPYEHANGVLCFERADLVTYMTLRDVGAAHTVPCEVVEKMVPNVVAYLFLVRGAKYTGEKNIPEFCSARCEIKVSPVNKRLNISLTTNAVYYAPEDKVQVDIAVHDWRKMPVKSHMAIMAVDEGVLTLTGFKTPDPLLAFICPRPTWMATQEYSSSHIQLLSLRESRIAEQKPQQESTPVDPNKKFRERGWKIKEYKPEPKPVPIPSISLKLLRCEDDHRVYEREAKSSPSIAEKEEESISSIKDDSDLGRQVAQRMSNIRIRKLFATTTYFNPALLTDEKGKVSVCFKLPENLTSFRIMAVAVDHDDHFGSADTRITVRKPLTLKVSLPRFAHVGDTFRAGVVVINQSGKEDDVICSLKADGILIKDEKIKKTRLADGASIEIPYELKAVRPGDATFTFAAFIGTHQDGVVEKIPIKYPATTETFATYGVVRDKSANEAILPPDKVWPGIGGLDVTFASTAMTNLQDGIKFLLTYPYGCIEQTSSRLFPLIGLHDLILEFHVEGLTDEEIRKRIAVGVERISSMQTSSGGFGYWPGSERINPWASAYALFVLLQVRDAGHSVSKDVIDKATNYLLQYTTQEREDVYGFCTNALALATLSMGGHPNIQAMERLYEKSKSLPIFAKAFLAYAYTLAPEEIKWKSRTLLQQILNQAVEEGDTVHFREENSNSLGELMHTDIRTDTIVMWLMCHMEPGHLLLPKLTAGIMKARIKGSWGNTQENAWALLALSKYLKAVEHEKPDFAAVIRIEYKELLRKNFQGRDTRSVQASLPIDQLIEASAGKQQPISIHKDGPGVLYYRLGITYAPARLGIPALERGITVDRKYEVIQGSQIPVPDGEILEYKLGTYVKVTLTVNIPKTRYFLAIDDALPAGFEHVNESFATSAKFDVGGYRFDHIEKRDDRALAFSDTLSPGTYQYIYVIRATTPGTYILPPGKAEEMYHPEIFGRTESQVVTIIK